MKNTFGKDESLRIYNKEGVMIYQYLKCLKISNLCFRRFLFQLPFEKTRQIYAFNYILMLLFQPI